MEGLTPYNPKKIKEFMKVKGPVREELDIPSREIAKKIEPQAYKLMKTIEGDKREVYKVLEGLEPVKSTEILGAIENGIDDLVAGTGKESHADYDKIRKFVRSFVMRQKENITLDAAKKTAQAELKDIDSAILKAEGKLNTPLLKQEASQELDVLTEQRDKLLHIIDQPFTLKAEKVRGLLDEVSDAAKFDATVDKKRQALARKFGSAKFNIEDLIRSRFEPAGYAEKWDDIVSKTSLLNDIQGNKNWMKKGDVEDNWQKWTDYAKKLKDDVIKEINQGEGADEAFRKLVQFDELMSTDFASTIHDKAMWKLSNVSPKGEEMGFVRGITSPTMREGLNVAKAIKENIIFKKISGTKWMKPLQEAFNTGGKRGLQATHMMLMHTDRKYRERNR